MDKFVEITLGIALFLSSAMYLFYKSEYEKASTQLVQANYEIQIDKANQKNLEDGIDIQNKKIESMKVDYNNSIKTYTVWKSLPKEVRYEVIYKDGNTTTIIKSSECNNTKARIDFYRNVDFNSL